MSSTPNPAEAAKARKAAEAEAAAEARKAEAAAAAKAKAIEAAEAAWNAEAPAIADAPNTRRATTSDAPSIGAIMANPLGHALRHPASGKGAAPLLSLTPAHVAAIVRGGTVGGRDYPAVPVGLAVYCLGHKARQGRAELRGDALYHAAASYAAFMLAATARPEAASDKLTVRVARAFRAASVPADFTPAHALRAASGEAWVYTAAQNAGL